VEAAAAAATAARLPRPPQLTSPSSLYVLLIQQQFYNSKIPFCRDSLYHHHVVTHSEMCSRRPHMTHASWTTTFFSFKHKGELLLHHRLVFWPRSRPPQTMTSCNELLPVHVVTATDDSTCQSDMTLPNFSARHSLPSSIHNITVLALKPCWDNGCQQPKRL